MDREGDKEIDQGRREIFGLVHTNFFGLLLILSGARGADYASYSHRLFPTNIFDIPAAQLILLHM